VGGLVVDGGVDKATGQLSDLSNLSAVIAGVAMLGTFRVAAVIMEGGFPGFVPAFAPDRLGIFQCGDQFGKFCRVFNGVAHTDSPIVTDVQDYSTTEGWSQVAVVRSSNWSLSAEYIDLSTASG